MQTLLYTRWKEVLQKQETL